MYEIQYYLIYKLFIPMIKLISVSLYTIYCELQLSCRPASVSNYIHGRSTSQCMGNLKGQLAIVNSHVVHIIIHG